MNEATKAATAAMREMSDAEVRERVIRVAFGGDRERFERFLDVLRQALPADVSVLLRGSAVIGVRWEDGSPFDADGPGTSDLDLTLVGGDMLKLWEDDAFYIPKLHTAPLNEKTPHACPPLVPLRRALCKVAGRPVNLQATASLVQYARDVLFDQPYHTLIDGDESQGDAADGSAEGQSANAASSPEGARVDGRDEARA